MGSTNAEVEQEVLANIPPIKDNENVNDSGEESPAEKPQDNLTYDQGMIAWLQVLGSFFLFFNSWYESFLIMRAWNKKAANLLL